MRKLVSIVALLALLAAVGASAYQLERLESNEPEESKLLYLPKGDHLKLMSLGHRGLMADAIYLWAIQFYSSYGREDRYKLVQHVFGDVIGELDPNYIDPYWIGALILTTEAKDLEGGLQLLEDGMEANPDDWVLPYIAGWEAAQFKEFDLATEYFERAARIDGAPPVVVRLRAGMQVKAGDLDEALELWQEVLDDPRSDDTSRAIAKRRIRSLSVQKDIRDLESIVAQFRERYGRSPRGLEELVETNYLPFVPVSANGKAYRFDATTGRVLSDAGRVVGGG